MMPSLLILSALCFFTYCSVALVCLYRNYRQAQQTGLPIVVAPSEPFNPLWRAFAGAFAPLLKHFQWARIINATWSWEDNDLHHAQRGDSFMLVTPWVKVLFTRDEAAVESVLVRRKEFVKPAMYENLALFGKNLNTVNGEDWARHRRLTAPCFNENVSKFAWTESVRQAQAMRDSWLSQPQGKTSQMINDTRIIALHVLYSAGFGVSHDFLGGTRNPAPGHQLSHRDAIMTILQNIISSVILSQMMFVKKIQRILTPHWRSILLALKEYQQYMDEIVASERRIAARENGHPKTNLISSLIRASDQAKSEGVPSAVRLTDDEIKGNIFMFNFAGHDTTANTLAYAFALLAVHSDVQDWVLEEVNEVLAGDDDPNYEEVFPRLKRVLAVMYETLRQYGPVTAIPRCVVIPTPLLLTNLGPKSSSPTNTVLVQPNTQIQLVTHAMHMSPKNFPNPEVWNPMRWIVSSSSTLRSLSSNIAQEKLVHMDQGFAPWATGPRVCPGMKFAQVEFVAVLSTVLRGVRIAPTVRGDVEVGKEEARANVMAAVRDSTMETPTLMMRRPEAVWLKVSRC